MRFGMSRGLIPLRHWWLLLLSSSKAARQSAGKLATVVDCRWRGLQAASHHLRGGSETTATSRVGNFPLKVETDLSGQRSRRDVVRSTEGGEKVIQRRLVGWVDGRETQTPLVALAAEEVIVPHAEIE